MTDDPRSISNLRKDYRRASLDESEVDRDPLAQLASWLADASNARVTDPTAMTLATADAAGTPTARTVLCKGLDARGLAFYTNLSSRKAHDLEANPRAAAVFLWKDLQRQATVRGTVEPVDESEADAYFASRPRDSQLGAWASPQSQPVTDRAELDRRLTAVTDRFAGADVPRPPFWGGRRLVPAEVEFWQGRPGRLHDRLLYRRADVDWELLRLAP